MIEALIVIPIVILIVFGVLNLVFAARSQLILDYASFVVARVAAVRSHDEMDAGKGQAKSLLALTTGDLGTLMPDNKWFQPLKITVGKIGRRVKATISLVQRRKWVFGDIRTMLTQGSLLEGIHKGYSWVRSLLYKLESTSVVPYENYPKPGDWSLW